MKIQQIANTSIITRGSRQGNGVAFSGTSRTAKNNGMPKFGASLPKTPLSTEKTIFQEVKNLFADAFEGLNNSYRNSEIKRVFVNPVSNKINKITAKSPQLTQAVKGAAVLTAGVALTDYAIHKLNLEG